MTISKFKTASYILRKDGLGRLVLEFIIDFHKMSSRIKWIDNVFYKMSKTRLLDRVRSEKCLDDIIDTASNFTGYGYYSLNLCQIREEVKSLAEIVKQISSRVILEIGSAGCGSLYVWCRYFGSAKKIISIDLPGGEFGGGHPIRKEQLLKEVLRDKEIYFLRGDSHNDEVKRMLSEVLRGEKVNFLFIDGDHTYVGVKKDFRDYEPFMADGGIIAFHDIVHARAGARASNPNCNVDKFWREIRVSHVTKEIIASEDQGWAGIGIIYI